MVLWLRASDLPGPSSFENKVGSDFKGYVEGGSEEVVENGKAIWKHK